MTEDIAIRVTNLSKKYFLQEQRTFKELIPALLGGKKGGQFIWALKDINFTVKKGEVIGIIGQNGSGKSTLLKLIAGVTQPTEGELTVSGKISPLIELGAGFHPELTGRENVYLNASILGIPKHVVENKFQDIVEFAELGKFIDSPVKHYSSGMYTRLAFSVAVNVEPEVLLIDEILAVGDTKFQQKCLAKMSEFKKHKVTIVYVSHSLKQVADFCERAIFLNKGRVMFEGEAKKATDVYKEYISI